ncbi:hypothetical protein GCM10022237_28630 [Nocardioides ginsengisoli]
MSVATLAPPHPVVGCVSALRDVLAEVADVQPAFMATADKRWALVQLAQARAQLAELELRVLAASDEVGDATGARDCASWLAHVTRCDPRAARAERRLAAALERHERLAAGMRSGTVSEEQARVVAAALDDLPAHLGRDAHAAAEATMVRHCAEFGPRELRLLGRRLVEVAAPEIAEAEDGKRLEAEERRARETASLRFRDLGHGRTRVSGTLPTSLTQRLQHYLQAWTSPRRPGVADEGEWAPQHRAYADAFGQLLEAIDPDGLPQHGGDATTVLVTVTLDQLRAELAAAGVIAGDGEEKISAGEARRLACQATIVPAVLGGARRAGRGARPRPGATTVQPRAATGAPAPRPRVPGRGLHDPGRVDRGPSPTTVVRGRPHRSRQRDQPLRSPPSPGARPALRDDLTARRRRPLPSADVGAGQRPPKQTRQERGSCWMLASCRRCARTSTSSSERSDSAISMIASASSGESCGADGAPAGEASGVMSNWKAVAALMLRGSARCGAPAMPRREVRPKDSGPLPAGTTVLGPIGPVV